MLIFLSFEALTLGFVHLWLHSLDAFLKMTQKETDITVLYHFLKLLALHSMNHLS